jgi:hypothetical protein
MLIVAKAPLAAGAKLVGPVRWSGLSGSRGALPGSVSTRISRSMENAFFFFFEPGT